MKVFKFIKTVLKKLRKPCKLYEISLPGNVYYRFTYSKKYLKKKHFVQPFGINSDLCNMINKARIKYNEENPDNKLPVREDFKDHYDNRIGYYVDGTKINTRIHPLHSKQLMDVKTKKKYIIDTVTIMHYYGSYMTLMVREEGSKSHKQVMWENYTSMEPDNIKRIKQNRKQFILIDKFDPFTL